jgi:aspartate/methionine/tyrosine aminotransferase
MPAINPQAQELNDQLAAATPAIVNMLSERGKRIFFPAKGILGQAAAARGKDINATIGIALEDDGSPLRLACIEEHLELAPAKAFPYAPSFGVKALRDLWKNMLYAKNPSLLDHDISTPVVTSALTHGLSMCGYLFMDPGDKLYTPDKFWGNYKLVFNHGYDAEISTYNTFKDGGFDVEALRAALAEDAPGKRVVLLNFPNNPTGYTVTPAEAGAIRDVLVEAADAGNELVVLIDDAYFGLVYADGILKESIFTQLVDAHENLLAVKIDGATKEDYVWGFRVGFLTYGIKGGTEQVYAALEAKTAGAIRGNISNSPHPSQSIMLGAYSNPEYTAQKEEKYKTLKRRYDKVCEILETKTEYAEEFEALPFNSGYFMCIRLKNAEPEAVRQVLLDEFSTGVIAAAGVIRVAFSAAPYGVLDQLFENIYQAARKVSGA